MKVNKYTGESCADICDLIDKGMGTAFKEGYNQGTKDLMALLIKKKIIKIKKELKKAVRK